LKHKGGCVLDGQYADYSATTASKQFKQQQQGRLKS